MTEERQTDSELVKRAEAALASEALREPDWDGLVQRIEGGLAAAPASVDALFDAPLPAVAEEGPAEAQPSAAVMQSATDDAGPSITMGPESAEEIDEGWSSAPVAADTAVVAEASVVASAADVESAVDVTSAADASAEPADLESAADAEPEHVAEAQPALELPEPRREGVSLADLARASVARRGAAEAASIAKESLAMASQSRAQGDQIAQRVHATHARSEQGPSTERSPGARRGELTRGPWIGVGIAALGLAAGFGLFLSGQRNAGAPVAVVEPVSEQPLAKQGEPSAPQRVPQPEAKVAEKGPAPTEEVIPEGRSFESLAREPLPHSGAAKAVGAGVQAPSAAPKAAVAKAGSVAAEKVVLEEDQKAAPKAVQAASAAPTESAKLRPAELSSNGMSERPSAGAAQAAVGAVLGAARACVAGQPQPSSAQLVFGSDGQVQSVTVGGAAAGTPAAGCIEAALKKARVQPFAASSFSLAVTVRPP